jgi:hypothetical protein
MNPKVPSDVTTSVASSKFCNIGGLVALAPTPLAKLFIRCTSLRQGRFREEGAGGSVRLSSRRSPAANRRADEQKRHRRLRPPGELAQHSQKQTGRATGDGEDQPLPELEAKAEGEL